MTHHDDIRRVVGDEFRRKLPEALDRPHRPTARTESYVHPSCEGYARVCGYYRRIDGDW